MGYDRVGSTERFHVCTANLNLVATVSLSVRMARKPPVPIVVRLQESPSETEKTATKYVPSPPFPLPNCTNLMAPEIPLHR